MTNTKISEIEQTFKDVFEDEDGKMNVYSSAGLKGILE